MKHLLFADCSRFWVCDGSSLEACLFECDNCQQELGTDPRCDGQWALAFDASVQYPTGPICTWPNEIPC